MSPNASSGTYSSPAPQCSDRRLSRSSSSLMILPGPEVLASPDTNVTLTCIVAGDAVHHDLTLKWLFEDEVRGLCHFSSGEFPEPFTGHGAFERQCNLTVGPVDRSSVGIYKCQYFDGEQAVSQNLIFMIDINECDDESTNDCDANADCVDLDDGYDCICKDGFNVDEATGSCQRMNECDDDSTNDCDANADCVDLDDGYDCICKEGFNLDEATGSCQRMNECDDDSTNDCDANADCVDLDDGYDCICKDGFKVDEATGSCQRMNECDDDSTNDCDANADCVDLDDGYDCICKDGFTVDEATGRCQRMNECDDESRNDCDANADCVDLVDGYDCICKDGFKVDEATGSCQRMNECDDDSTNDCNANADCVDLDDGYDCICKDGFNVDKDTGSCQKSNLDGSIGVNNGVVAVCASVALLIIAVVGLTVFARLSVKRNRGQASVTQNAMLSTEAAESAVAMLVSSYEDRIAQAAAVSYESIRRRDLASKGGGLPSWAKPWEILWSDLLLDDEVLGRGNFGEVRSGAVRIGGKVIRAAIKMLKEHSSSSEKDDFMQELKTMSSVGHHVNIVCLFGACKHQDVLYVALEYLPYGNLRSYLRTARSQSDSDEDALSSDQLVKFALDVAKGMEHLAQAGVIHRDLAARNILVGEALVAKVSDFGLSRGEDVYTQMSSKRVPLRWLAIESVRLNTYTTKSDVWSFGILLWEIATVGGTPYPTIDSDFLPGKLLKGYRMAKPSNCDDHSYALMLKCWNEDPNKRPTFTELVSILSGMAVNNTNSTYMAMDGIRYINWSAIRPEFDDK
ncbi:ALK tyrosine kinase receptor homolog scd-2-like [Patiria miniata]|uniref:receptor protein-tyrosine kinase n=1 Tax=Patiria miniata TaxID=46514 RepID=A0A914AFG0_PATMI|nr:ALK tyrosine kinase receptor homolog scd-2-like [Patiria miniata]